MPWRPLSAAPRSFQRPHHDQTRIGPFRPADSPLTFGGNVFGWTVDEAGTYSLLDALVDAGLNFIDTADVYSRWVPGNQGGESETLIGKWLKRSGKRDRVLIATSCRHGDGPRRREPGARLHPPFPEASLRPPADRPRRSGPIAPGRSGHAPDRHPGRIRQAHRVRQGARHRRVQLHRRAPVGSADRQRTAQPAALRSIQPEYSLYRREPFESGLQSLAKTQQMGTINYYALASGFLSGKYRCPADAGKRPARPQDRRHLPERPRLPHPEGAGRGLGKKPAARLRRPALAWQIAWPGITSPSSAPPRWRSWTELVKAASLALTRDQLAKLSQASDWR